MTINERFFKLLDEKKVSQKDFCEAKLLRQHR